MAKKVKKKQKKKVIKKHPWWQIGALLLVTFILFSPSLQNEFVNWDDDRNLYENPNVLNLNWNNVKTLFTSDVIGNYNPLSNLTLSIEHALFEGSDNYHALFHLVNILLHLLCVWLVYQVVLAMGLPLEVALITAGIFGIHPMRVESVTWITEIKDVLYASFYFGAMLIYLKGLQKHKNKLNVKALGLFGIGLFAKIQMVVLPISLVLLDYWKGSKNFVQSGLRKWPYFLLALGFGIFGVYLLSVKGSLEGNDTFTLFQRIFIGTYSLCIYIIKSILPWKLSPLYPYPGVLSIWHYLSVIPFLGFLFFMYWTWKKDLKIYFFGSAFFFVNVVLMLQVLGAGQGYLADRFTYVAYFGLFLIYAYLIDLALKTTKYKSLGYAAIAIGILGYGYLTFNQTKVWKNSGTLWSHVLKYYDNSTLPYGNRANFYRDNGEWDKALADYSSTIRLKPNNAAPYNSRAKLYFARNEDERALKDYIKAVELEPDNTEYLINRGAAYAKLGRWNEALADFDKGIELNPNSRNGYLNRSLAYQNLGRAADALKDLNAYLKYDPNNSDIWYESGRMHGFLGNNEEGIKAFTKAISLQAKGPYYLERSKLYFQTKMYQECLADLKKAQSMGSAPSGTYLQALKSQNLQ